ncbi:cell division protein PerM [Streptomyces sp. NBC_00690]|uniref:cell division protein PerM n=1 Tax=Streptomyces sp. NBC_00690 TaxID=2975808 RepID=UPI002E29BCA9|nr:DUF6350 family protein [Streptomyces sp. NBC_00690]
MTQTTDHGTFPAPAPVLVQGRRKAALVACFARGATTAGLGLGAIAVLVMVLWISSPYPDSGPQGALHVAAGIWLLAHGTELVRTDTLTGPPAPMGLVPLLLVALPVWLVHRAARDALLPANGRPRPSAGGVICAVSAGYLLVGAAATVYAARGPLIADTRSAVLHLPLVTVLAAVAGVWTASGRPGGSLPTWLPRTWRLTLARTWLIVAVRAAVAGVLALFGGGALLVAAALVWHADATQDTFLHLASVWSGRLAVLLLGLVLVPNAAVWAAAYGLGPGFTLGTGATATPIAVSADPALPPFPLLAAVPAEGPGTPWNWACAAVPLIAALVIARFVTATAAPRGAPRAQVWSNRETALTALCGAVGCGLLTAAMAAASGGALGTGRLTHFGPVWWQSGGAALLWSAAIAIPVSVLLRVWRVRGQRAPQSSTADESGPRPSMTAARAVRVDEVIIDDGGDCYDFLPTEPWRERDDAAHRTVASTSASTPAAQGASTTPPPLPTPTLLRPAQPGAGSADAVTPDGHRSDEAAGQSPSAEPSRIDWAKRQPEIGTAWMAPRPESGPGAPVPVASGAGHPDPTDVHSKEAGSMTELTPSGEGPTVPGTGSGTSTDAVARPSVSLRKPWSAPPSPWPSSPGTPRNPDSLSSPGDPDASDARTGEGTPRGEGNRESTPDAPTVADQQSSTDSRKTPQAPGQTDAPGRTDPPGPQE